MLEADTRREGWPAVSEPDRRQFLASTLELLPAAHGRSDQRQTLERPLLILLAGTALVLLLACLNVANLLLARAFAHRRELAVRAALGASGGRLARELAVQTGLLALAGAIAGALLAPLVVRALLHFLPDTVTLQPRVDGRVFVFALTIAVLTALLFGLAPARLASRTQPSQAQAMKVQSGTVAGGVRLRRLLVVGQFALALVLLVGAGLFARTLAGLRARAEVIRPDLLTFRVDFSRSGQVPEEARRRVGGLLDELRALPEVDSAALSRIQLMAGAGFNMRYTVGPGDPATTGEVQSYFVSSAFFSTLGVPFLEGRDFRPPGSGPAAPAAEYTSAIVNQAFVQRYLRGRDPIGARLGFGVRVTPSIEIVGVVRDFHHRGLRASEVQVYFPALEKPLQGGTYFVRTRGPSRSAFDAVRAAVRRVDAGVPVLGLHTLSEQVDSALTSERLLSALASAFALLAVLLALLGLHGVMSFLVSRRTRELGIRQALGATAAGAVGLVMREAALLIAAGAAIGLGTAWALGRSIESQLFGVGPMDPAVLAGATLILTVVGLLASVWPARRAAAVNALEALRAE
jgi:predicted permease